MPDSSQARPRGSTTVLCRITLDIFTKPLRGNGIATAWIKKDIGHSRSLRSTTVLCRITLDIFTNHLLRRTEAFC